MNNFREAELALLFGPEHGLRGEEDSHVSNAASVIKQANPDFVTLQEVDPET